MLQPRGEPDLALEPLGTEGGGELGMQHLERDRPVVPEVPGEEDRGHPPAPELALERVAPLDPSWICARRSAMSAYRRRDVLPGRYNIRVGAPNRKPAAPVTRGSFGRCAPSGCSALRGALHQLPEPRVLPQRIERRIDPEPPRREIVRRPEQRLEPVQRLLRLADEDVDPGELVLQYGPL